jgi:hypothetical protein
VPFVLSRGLDRLIRAATPDRDRHPDLAPVSFFHRLLRTCEPDIIGMFLQSAQRNNSNSNRSNNNNDSCSKLSVSSPRGLNSDCRRVDAALFSATPFVAACAQSFASPFTLPHSSPGLALLSSWIAFFAQLPTVSCVPACVSALAIADIVIKSTIGNNLVYFYFSISFLFHFYFISFHLFLRILFRIVHFQIRLN